VQEDLQYLSSRAVRAVLAPGAQVTVEPPPTSTEHLQPPARFSTEQDPTGTGMGERLPEFSAQVGGHKILKVRDGLPTSC